MNATGELKVGYATFRHMAVNEARVKIRLFVGRVFALFLIGSGVWHLATERPTPFHAVIFLFAFGLIGLQEGLIWLSWLVQRRRYAAPARYEVTSEGATAITGAGSESVQWARVSRVHRGRHAWTVKREGGAIAFVIPRAAFTPEESRTVNEFFLANPMFAG